MNGAVLFYQFYASIVIRIVRFFIAGVLIAFCLLQQREGALPTIPAFFLIWFLLFEMFFRFSLSQIRPAKTIEQVTPETAKESATMPILLALARSRTFEKAMQKLWPLPQVKFVTRKAGILRRELSFIPVSEDEVWEKALDIAKQRGGTVITSMDIFAAYLYVSELQTQLLFLKEIRPTELPIIVRWATVHFPYEEHPQKTRVTFTQSGIGETLTTGWTPNTQKYTFDLTSQILSKQPLIVGREKEFEEMIATLTKNDHNNVLLVADSGSGKHALVEAFGYYSFEGTLPHGLNGKKILELRVSQVLAGAANRSDVEERLEEIIQEISHAGNIVLFIPEFQNVVGAGSFGIDLSGALLPYLRNGVLPVIGSITAGNYKTYVEKHPIQENITVIALPEPDTHTSLSMMFHRTDAIEAESNCIITYQAIVSAIALANRYLPDNVLPGSAVRLLQDAAHSLAHLSQAGFFGASGKKLLTKAIIIHTVEQRIHTAVAAPQAEEKSLLLHLEEKLHERVIGQMEAIQLISEAMRRLRTGLSASQKPISFLFLGPTGVGKTETAKTLASLYYGGEQQMLRFDMSEYSSEDGVKRLLGAAPGQGEERGELTDRVHDNPNALVLLDEFEKAHPTILNLFLQVLDDGRLTDNKGQTVSFVNCIIIATSNAGSEFIRESVKHGERVDKAFQQKLLDTLQSTHLFKPELLNRFNAVVTFTPLGKPEIASIVKLMLEKLTKQLAEKDITVYYDDALITKIVEEGYNQEFGARPIARYIEDNVEDILAQKMLKDEIQRGTTVIIGVNEQNEITMTVNNVVV